MDAKAKCATYPHKHTNIIYAFWYRTVSNLNLMQVTLYFRFMNNVIFSGCLLPFVSIQVFYQVQIPHAAVIHEQVNLAFRVQGLIYDVSQLTQTLVSFKSYTVCCFLIGLFSPSYDHFPFPHNIMSHAQTLLVSVCIQSGPF